MQAGMGEAMDVARQRQLAALVELPGLHTVASTVDHALASRRRRDVVEPWRRPWHDRLGQHTPLLGMAAIGEIARPQRMLGQRPHLPRILPPPLVPPPTLLPSPPAHTP